MPFPITCPACKTTSPCPDAFAGKKVKCRKCAHPFVAQAPSDEPDIIDDAEVIDDFEEVEAPKPKAKPKPPTPPKPVATAKKRPADDEDDEEDDDDDDDAPKTKKGKKAPPPVKVSGAVYAIMAVTGLFLLLLGAGLSYWAATSTGKKPSDKVASNDPTPNQSTPKGNVGPGPAGGVVGPGPGGGIVGKKDDLAGWVTVNVDGYSIKFPQRPTAVMEKHNNFSGKETEVKIQSLELPPDVFVSGTGESGIEPGSDVEMALDQWANVLPMVFAGKAKERAPRKITYQGYPGRELEMDINAPGQTARLILRVILAGDRFFILARTGLDITASSPRVKGFFDSLKIN